jgi:hypothetical protein
VAGSIFGKLDAKGDEKIRPDRDISNLELKSAWGSEESETGSSLIVTTNERRSPHRLPRGMDST